MAYNDVEDVEATITERVRDAMAVVAEGFKAQAILTAFIAGQIVGFILARL